MCSIITQGNRQCAALSDLYKPLGAGLLQCGFHAQSRSDDGLHNGAVVFQQCLERLVVLSERIGLLASGRADLHRRLYAQATQRLGQLRVGHQVLFGDKRLTQQLVLHVLHLGEVSNQRPPVQLQHRLSEHADGQVDQAELNLRKTRRNPAEQVVGQVCVVAAIPTVAGKLLRREVQTHLTQRVDNLVALRAQPVTLGSFG